jgi:hypothetical protein
MVAKNKLHNRYLHGWGVVCGMEVVCSPCNNLVTVQPGYALSPCGDDIVVCSPAPVDICALISKCRPRRSDDCFQPAQGNIDPCYEGNEPWVLSICYDEKPSRGITPLSGGGTPCCSQCSCGGSSSCGCGCHGQSQKSKPSTALRTPPQCEPTITCEGYTFKVSKQPPPSTMVDLGALLDRWLCCIQPLKGIITQPPTDPQQIPQWCCQMRDNLLELFASHPAYECGLPQRLAALCASGSSVNTIVTEVAVILGQYLYYCFCSVLLPPCGPAVEDNCVPLSAVTVSKRDCRIVRVCNLDARKFATTFPALQYWLSPFQIGPIIRKALERICCRPFALRNVNIGGGRTAYQNPLSTDTPPDQMRVVMMLALSAWMQKGRIIDPQTVGMALLGLTDEQGKPFLSQLELDHAFETVMLNDVGLPFVEDILPSALTGINVSGTGSTQDQVNQLHQIVATMQKTIDELKQRLGNSL